MSPRFMVQNAAGIIRPQLVGYICYLIISIPAKWFATAHVGITAIPYVGVAVYALTVLPAALYGHRRALDTAKYREASTTDDSVPR